MEHTIVRVHGQCGKVKLEIFFPTWILTLLSENYLKKKVASEGMSEQVMDSRYFQTSILPIISFTGTWNTVFPIKSTPFDLPMWWIKQRYSHFNRYLILDLFDAFLELVKLKYFSHNMVILH